MTKQAEFLVTDAGNLRRYRTEIPNIVDEMDLDPYAFRLYVHLKRVAGDSGKCWQSTKTLADACRMSAGKVSHAKQDLVNAGLITITSRSKGSDIIRITDVWDENFSRFRVHLMNGRQRSVHLVNAPFTT